MIFVALIFAVAATLGLGWWIGYHTGYQDGYEDRARKEWIRLRHTSRNPR